MYGTLPAENKNPTVEAAGFFNKTCYRLVYFKIKQSMGCFSYCALLTKAAVIARAKLLERP